MYQSDDHKLPLAFSFGLAIYPEQPKNLEALISIADAKIFNNKNLKKCAKANLKGRLDVSAPFSLSID